LESVVLVRHFASLEKLTSIEVTVLTGNFTLSAFSPLSSSSLLFATSEVSWLGAGLITVSSDMSWLFSGQPCLSLAINPLTLSLGLLGDVIPDSASVILVVLELTDVSVSVYKLLDTSSLHLSVLELTVVSGLVWPDHDTSAVHGIVSELTLIDLSAFGEVVFSMTMEFSIDEVTLIVRSLELESSRSSLLAINEVSGVLDLTLVPDLSTDSVLFVIDPLTIVHGAVLVDEASTAVGFAIFPLTLVDVSIGMSNSSLAVEELVDDHTLVEGSI